MNNFDMSSTGENIEFFCFYDTSLAQMNYDYFAEYEAKRLDFGRNSAIFLVGDCDASHYTKSKLARMSKQALYDLCHDLELIGWSARIDDFVKADLIDALMEVSHKDYYELATKMYSWHDFANHIEHDWYISRGYSQGDAVYIVSLQEAMTKSYRDYIDHVLWDAPICVRAKIESKIASQDFDTEYFLDDEYTWDKRVIADKIAVLPVGNDAKAFLLANLPDYPSYN